MKQKIGVKRTHTHTHTRKCMWIFIILTFIHFIEWIRFTPMEKSIEIKLLHKNNANRFLDNIYEFTNDKYGSVFISFFLYSRMNFFVFVHDRFFHRGIFCCELFPQNCSFLERIYHVIVLHNVHTVPLRNVTIISVCYNY